VAADNARRTAQAELKRWNDALIPDRLTDPHATSHDPGDEVVVTGVDEHTRAWVVYFATKRWLETRDVSDALAGTCPLVVDKATGDLHVYGSGEHSQYEVWLDPPTPQ
jgi:hypothetical protein